MAGNDTKTLELTRREDRGSRAMRRLRRSGRVPAVVYGGDGDPVAVEVDARILRHTLAHAHAVIELTVDGGDVETVMLKDAQRHPVRGEIVHADFLRVRMDVTIQSTVSVTLEGGEDAPGVSEGGVLSHDTRELNIEALPGDIPDTITVDVSGLGMNDTLTLASVTAPRGVKLLDDPETTVIATITPPTAEPVEEEIETETELVGEAVAGDEAAEAAQAQAEGATGDEARSGESE